MDFGRNADVNSILDQVHHCSGRSVDVKSLLRLRLLRSDVALADNWNDFLGGCKAFDIIPADNRNDFLTSINVTVMSTDGPFEIVYVAKTLHVYCGRRNLLFT